MICQCGCENDEDAVFCINCGHRIIREKTPLNSEAGNPKKEQNEELTIETWKCQNCGIINSSESSFCSNCGNPKNISKTIQNQNNYTESKEEPSQSNSQIVSERPKSEENHYSSKNEDKGTTILLCIILFFMGVWSGIVLPVGGGVSFVATIPGAISITIIRNNKGSSVPLFITLFIGAAIGFIASGKW